MNPENTQIRKIAMKIGTDAEEYLKDIRKAYKTETGEDLARICSVGDDEIAESYRNCGQSVAEAVADLVKMHAKLKAETGSEEEET